jgi:hypothetical protein
MVTRMCSPRAFNPRVVFGWAQSLTMSALGPLCWNLLLHRCSVMLLQCDFVAVRCCYSVTLLQGDAVTV